MTDQNDTLTVPPDSNEFCTTQLGEAVLLKAMGAEFTGSSLHPASERRILKFIVKPGHLVAVTRFNRGDDFPVLGFITWLKAYRWFVNTVHPKTKGGEGQ